MKYDERTEVFESLRRHGIEVDKSKLGYGLPSKHFSKTAGKTNMLRHYEREAATRYLMHHGINGQRWGVKHGPPYPLGSGVSTGSSLRKGARAKHIVKSATAGAAIGAIAGGIVGGPVGAGLSAAASAAASAAKAAWKTRKKKVNIASSKNDNSYNTEPGLAEKVNGIQLIKSKLMPKNVNLTLEDKKNAQKEAMKLIDEPSDYKITETKKSPYEDGYIVNLENNNEPDLDMWVKLKKDSKSGKMVIDGAGQGLFEMGTKSNNTRKVVSDKMINKWKNETKGGNYISDALESALFDDDYDMEFLEKIQNESYFSGNDDTSVDKRLKEYKKYLINKNPEEAKFLGYK